MRSLILSMTKDHARLEKRIAAALAILLAGAFLVLTIIVVPGFERLLTEAEFNLPRITQLAIDSSPYWNIFGVLALTGYFLVEKSRNGPGWLLIVAASVVLIAIVPFLVMAMYEPIFQLE